MAFVAFEDCIRVESRWVTDADKPMEMTLWGRKLSGTVDQDDVTDAATAFDTWADLEVKPLVVGNMSYVETYARDMTAAISFQAQVNISVGAGARVGTPCEDHSAIVVQRKSGLVGRSANGRVYAFGGTVGDRTNASNWLATYVEAWENALTDSDAVWDSIGFLPIIASPTLRVSTGQVLLSTFEVLTWVGSINIAAYRARSNPA